MSRINRIQSVNSLSIEEITSQSKYAALALIPYGGYDEYLPAGWVDLTKTDKLAVDYTYSVFRHFSDGQGSIVMSERGTEAKEWNTSLSAGLYLLSTSKAHRLALKESEDYYKKLHAKYPKATITITGHSQGASKGLYLASKHNLTFYGFDVLNVDTEDLNKYCGKKPINWDTKYRCQSDPNDLNALDEFNRSHGHNYAVPKGLKAEAELKALQNLTLREVIILQTMGAAGGLLQSGRAKLQKLRIKHSMFNIFDSYQDILSRHSTENQATENEIALETQFYNEQADLVVAVRELLKANSSALDKPSISHFTLPSDLKAAIRDKLGCNLSTKDESCLAKCLNDSKARDLLKLINVLADKDSALRELINDKLNRARSDGDDSAQTESKTEEAAPEALIEAIENTHQRCMANMQGLMDVTTLLEAIGNRTGNTKLAKAGTIGVNMIKIGMCVQQCLVSKSVGLAILSPISGISMAAFNMAMIFAPSQPSEMEQLQRSIHHLTNSVAQGIQALLSVARHTRTLIQYCHEEVMSSLRDITFQLNHTLPTKLDEIHLDLGYLIGLVEHGFQETLTQPLKMMLARINAIASDIVSHQMYSEEMMFNDMNMLAYWLNEGAASKHLTGMLLFRETSEQLSFKVNGEELSRILDSFINGYDTQAFAHIVPMLWNYAQATGNLSQTTFNRAMMPNIDIWYRALKAYLYIRKMCDTKYGIAAYDRSDTELNGLFKIVHTTCTRLTQLYSSEGIIIDLFEKISEALEQWKTITSGNIKQRILTAPIETLFPSGIPDNVDFQYPGNYSGSHQGTLISSFKHLSNFNEQQALQLVCNNYQRRYGMPLFQEAFLRAQKLGLVEFRYQMFCSLRRPHTSHGYYENPENRLGLSVQMVIKSTGVVIELTRAQHGAGAMRGEMLDDLRRELDGSGPNWNPIRGGIAKSAKQIGPINTLIQTCQNTGIADHPNAELDNAISQCALLKAYLQINDIKFQKSGASACINAVEALFTNLKANVHSPDINLIEELGTEIETTQRAFNEFFEQLKDRSYSLTAIQVENQEEERMAPPLRDQLLQMAQSARQELIIYYHARNLKQHDLSNQKKQWRRCYNPITNPTSAMRCKGIWNKMSEPVVGSLSLLTVITALAYFIRSASDMALLRMALLRAVSTTLVCFGLFICLIQNCNKKNQQSEVHAHSTARI